MIAGRRRTRLVRALAVAGVLALTGLGSAGTAVAHSALERSNPADGAEVAVVPERLTLTFNQTVIALGSVIEVTGPDGKVSDGKPKVVDNNVRQAIEPGSPAGRYTVLWRVTSADGHPISGKFAFSAAEGSAGGAVEPTPTTGPSESAAGSATTGSAAPEAAATTAPDLGATDPVSDRDEGRPVLAAVPLVLILLGLWLSRRAGANRPDDEITSDQDAGSGPPRA